MADIRTQLRIPAPGERHFLKALVISLAFHLIAAVVVTVKAVSPPAAPQFIDLTMVPIRDLWSDPSMSPEPTPSLKAISYVEIIRKTAAPKLELYHHKYQWEDDIDALISAQKEAGTWDFVKEQPDYWFIFDNINHLSLVRSHARPGPDTYAGQRSEPGIHLSGGLSGRKITGTNSTENMLKKASEFLNRPVRLRIGVDEEGATRQAMLETPLRDADISDRVRQAVLGLRFEQKPGASGKTWGRIEIVPAPIVAETDPGDENTEQNP